MYNSLSYKSKQFFWLIIKLSIVIGCGYFIWRKLSTNSGLQFPDFFDNLIKNNIFSLKNTLTLFFLSFLNWFLEIIKWQTLSNNIKKVSFFEATKQSLASLTTSLITPNRIGEYGAKALYFDKKIRKKILTLNLIGNLHQLFATVFFGCLGLMYFVNSHNIYFNFKNFSYYIFIGLLVILSFIFLRKFLVSKKKLLKNFTVKLSKQQHFKISFLSFLRYLVFSHQFYFLLLIFKIDISYINAITAIFSIYLTSSAIPMLSLFDAVLKGTIAVFIFNFLNIDAFSILTITTSMWILNFVIPAIIGSYFVLTFKPKLTT